MKRSQRYVVVTLVVALVLALTAAVSSAVGDMTVSGTITAIDIANGTLTVTEIGPWTVTNGQTVITRRTFTLTAQTEFARVARGDSIAATGWVGDFVEAPAAADQLRPGDFVTVEVERSGSRLIARRVTTVDQSKT
ncbi:MAG TPA: DUF5666 domain-containing protein [Methylomirabilota bacterium]|nr:DUF5666 domain-containing protein [Methylomirabilota bacterium]